MATAVNIELRPGLASDERAIRRRTSIVGISFAILMAIQATGFLLLGTGQWGCGVSECSLVAEGFLAIGCAWSASRRAEGVTALFWFLFAIVLVVLLVPTALQSYETLFGQTVLSESSRALLYCVYGAPVLMMLFLPDMHRRARVKSEIFLDFFQIVIVVSLIYSTFFFLPVSRMLPSDALLHNVSISDIQSLLLVIAAMVRLQFARISASRGLLLRLTVFLWVCAITTFIGDRVALHYSASANAWFDLGWAVPQAVAGMIAFTWVSRPDPPSVHQPAKFLGFLANNLVLVTMLCGISLLMDRWKQTYGATLADVAIAASLLAFTLRLALTQFHQDREIVQRKAAQLQLAESHQRVGRLLDNARRQTAEVTQISELGSLLHACASREEIFRLIPERLRRLFSGASGSISLFSASRKRAESVVSWGVLCPSNQTFSPEQCWALRRGVIHAHPGGLSEPRCSHLLGESRSVCVPLNSNGETFGILTIQNDDSLPVDAAPDADTETEAFPLRRELAATVADNIALALANVQLRESLRLQAVRDPLTGLYNRRYMQEFLERELHSARRKQRPLAVLMLDLDHFKRYNDNFGHAMGDKALALVGETLLRCVRADDVSCRYGGEEFVLILPECSLQQATARAEEVRRRLQQQHAPTHGEPTDPITISIGVAAFEETTDRVDLLLKFADDALYQAKRAGGNRVVAALPASTLPNAAYPGPTITEMVAARNH